MPVSQATAKLIWKMLQCIVVGGAALFLEKLKKLIRELWCCHLTKKLKRWYVYYVLHFFGGNHSKLYCGPVFKPWCLKIDSVNAQVEPFPLVPLTCITLRLFNCSLDIPDSSRQSRTCWTLLFTYFFSLSSWAFFRTEAFVWRPLRALMASL